MDIENPTFATPDMLPTEKADLIHFNFDQNRYACPATFSEALTHLITQQELKDFVEATNTFLTQQERKVSSSPLIICFFRVTTLVAFVTFLAGLYLILANYTLSPKDRSTALYAWGIALIYLALVVIVFSTWKLLHTFTCLGPFAYFTPRVRKFLAKENQKVQQKGIRWALGKRAGAGGRIVETYDLLHVVWNEGTRVTPIVELVNQA